MCMGFGASYSMGYNFILIYITEINFIYILQASGPPLIQLALGPLPAPTSHSLPLTITRQYFLEGTNQEVTKSMTAILWILSQWYAQIDNILQLCKYTTHFANIETTTH